MAEHGKDENGVENCDDWLESATYKFARREYDIMDANWKRRHDAETDDNRRKAMEDDKSYGDAVHERVMELLKTFWRQGHSDLSASFALSEFARLANFQPLTPLTGDDSEWDDGFEGHNGELVQQNLRCFQVFRHNRDNSAAYNMCGTIFSDNGGRSWYANSESHEKIEFPYAVPREPKRKLVEKECKPE